jgi:ubiquitin-protein ligase
VGSVASPRLRRLAADYQAMRAEYSGHPHVSVQPLGPAPPEGYRITYQLTGLRLDGNTPVRTHHHVVEIRLPLTYPREQPHCVPLTPIFHPNIGEYYCIGDYWAAGETLVDIVAKIGDMIQFRSYNPKSPLDATAAYWAEQHEERLPIGNVALGRPELQIDLRPRSAATADVATAALSDTAILTEVSTTSTDDARDAASGADATASTAEAPHTAAAADEDDGIVLVTLTSRGA